jgi:hypothetical protein
MHSGSILAGAVLLSVMVPSLVSAGEVTPQPRSNRSPSTAGGVAGPMWVGFAVSPNQRVFMSEAHQAETTARNAAKNECETTTLRTCNVIAVPEATDVSAVGCSYGGKSKSFLGGSTQDAQKRIALDKANREGYPDSSCVEFYVY